MLKNPMKSMKIYKRNTKNCGTSTDKLNTFEKIERLLFSFVTTIVFENSLFLGLISFSTPFPYVIRTLKAKKTTTENRLHNSKNELIYLHVKKITKK